MANYAHAITDIEKLKSVARIAAGKENGVVLNIFEGDSNVLSSANGRDCGMTQGAYINNIPTVATHLLTPYENDGSQIGIGSPDKMFAASTSDSIAGAPAGWDKWLVSLAAAGLGINGERPVYYGSDRAGETRGLLCPVAANASANVDSQQARTPLYPGVRVAADWWYIDGVGGGSFRPGHMRIDSSPFTTRTTGVLTSCAQTVGASPSLQRFRSAYTVQAGDVGVNLNFMTSQNSQTVTAPVAVIFQQLSFPDVKSGFIYDVGVAIGGQPLRVHVQSKAKSGVLDWLAEKIKVNRKHAYERGVPFHICGHYQSGANDRNDATNSIGPRAGFAGVGSTSAAYLDNLIAYRRQWMETLEKIGNFNVADNFRIHLQVEPWSGTSEGAAAADTTQDGYRSASKAMASEFSDVMYSETNQLWNDPAESVSSGMRVDADHLTGVGQTVLANRFWQAVKEYGRTH